ncbi:protein MpNPF2 [Marchantia polymorpha subsp. ruderalis]|uniref:Major facilitator superfamily (MFS) profile domain-containing protein n=2 Tax=Marchantia polymorpha TaxID=3197 RepID=A0A176W2D1_MARPO|nr:hypothetical protein AXG93_4324s1330 [Marchantia polymorpha subsp. ruderalis]PTQ42150.1 hypothetical protein MARPO_0031s0118 [Marchantia polymorpha]BBN01101.1 hypothetical protein Mp_2g04630 [Marchantia polymorpha subsp. ruderalis]|eukprot:PTQ42150.1 hypothetical protein MARPO_0031s0118 [Marchantia polymorpha]
MPPLHKELMNEDLEENPVMYLDGGMETTLDLQGKPTDRTRSGRWKACSFLFAYEALERMAWLMLASNLVNYLQESMRDSQKVATRSVTNWVGVSHVTSLFGGYLADAYLGRFWTICVFSGVYLVGLLMMTMSVSIPALKPETCVDSSCADPTSAQVGVFYSALYVVALGTGGVWPCISAFGADQFEDREASEKSMRNSYFNWFFLTGAVGSLTSHTVLVYAQNNVNDQWRFGVPTISLSSALCVFLFGVSLYRFKQPKGNPLVKLAQVIVAAFRKRRVLLPLDDSRLYEERDLSKHKLAWSDAVAPSPPPPSSSRKLCHTSSFRCLDKAAVIDTIRIVDGTARIPLSRWRLCPVTQVEELKMVLRMAPVWMGTLMFNVVKAQVPTLFVQQGQAMDRRVPGSDLWVPAVSMQSAVALTVLFSIPIYDLVLVPLAKRYSGNERGLSLLQRMGCGMLLSVAAMVAAALVETRRLEAAARRGARPLSIFWLLPQFVLEGLGEVFTSVGQLEFFYDQAPDGMRTLGAALFVSNFGAAVFFDSLLTTLVDHITGDSRWIHSGDLNGGHLNYYYWLLAAMASVNLVLYMLSAICYRYKKVDTSCPSMDSRSFEWNASELGLMQKPTLFNHIQALKVADLQSPGKSPLKVLAS